MGPHGSTTTKIGLTGRSQGLKIHPPTSDKLLSLYDSVIDASPMTIEDAPVELVEFRKASKFQRLKDGEKFYTQDFIAEYLEHKWKVELHNKTSFLWLWEGYQNTKNKEKKQCLLKKMSEFKQAITSNAYPFQALAIDFTKHLFPEEHSPEVKNVADMFGGRIV